MATREDIIRVLKDIPDPELNVSVWDLGLIYDIAIDSRGDVSITMTLTSVGCPLYNLIAQPIQERVGKCQGVRSVDITLVFEPPWNPDMMSKDAKDMLGFV